MKHETRTAVYDGDLRIEAYRFEGIAQPFPNHFHEYYVIGLVERGTRRLSCKHRTYALQAGDMVLFNPGDSHACVQSDGGVFDYLGLNLSQEVMLDLAGEVSGQRMLPVFSSNVIRSEEAACCLRQLHRLVLSGSREFGKEECLLLLLSLLIQQYGLPFQASVPECREEIERTCRFIEVHYAQRLGLEQLCRCAGLSRSALLRAFTRAKGVTPYSYLENIRIGEARKLLERGIPPVEAALRTGFSDQSHFTNYFSRYIGLTPGAYRDIFLNKGNREGTDGEA